MVGDLLEKSLDLPDCVDKVPNRFELVLLAVHRAREIAKGSHITIEAENDKNPVIALREIAEKTIAPSDMREGLIHSIQGNVEVDEPEPRAAPTHPRPPMLRHDDQSTDTVVDMITEAQLLRGLESLTVKRHATLTPNRRPILTPRSREVFNG